MYYADRYARFLELSKEETYQAIIAACVHDTFKGGRGKTLVWTETVPDHGLIASTELFEFALSVRNDYEMTDLHNIMTDLFPVINAVRDHMGIWSPVPIHPTEMDHVSLCVAMADYAAAQKMVDEVDEILAPLHRNGVTYVRE
jgi:hypothetical protein